MEVAIRCDWCEREHYVLDPITDGELMREAKTGSAARERLRARAVGSRWTILSGGRFTRDHIACSDTCSTMISKNTPENMRAEGFLLGEYAGFFWPDSGVLPDRLMKGWPPPKAQPNIRSPRVYVSGPLRGQGESTGQNIHAAIMAGVQLAESGYVPFVPHLFHLADTVSPQSDDFWLKLDRAWLPVCGAIVRLPGPSVGADMEVSWAQEFGVPVWEGLDAFLKDRPIPLSEIIEWPEISV